MEAGGAQSLRQRLIRMILFTVIPTVLVVLVGLAGYERYRLHDSILQRVEVLADAVAANSAAALSFQDEDGAADVVSSLRADRHIAAAALIGVDGIQLAVYQRDTGEVVRDLGTAMVADHAFSLSSLVVRRPVAWMGESVGSIVVQADLTEMQERLPSYLLIVTIILLIAGGVAYLVATRVQRVISEPLSRLRPCVTAPMPFYPSSTTSWISPRSRPGV